MIRNGGERVSENIIRGEDFHASDNENHGQ